MSSRKNWTGVFERNWDKLRKKRSPSLPIFSSISPRSFSKTPVKASKSFVSQRLTIPLTRNRLLDRGASLPCTPHVRQRHTRNFTIVQKRVSQWRTCTLGLQLSLRSNADPSVTFGTSFASPKRRENEPFSLTTRQAHASLVYPFLPSIVLSQQVPSDKSRQHQSSPFLPNQNCNKKHHLITKKSRHF